jgi:hypothetical protein
MNATWRAPSATGIPLCFYRNLGSSRLTGNPSPIRLWKSSRLSSFGSCRNPYSFCGRVFQKQPTLVNGERLERLAHLDRRSKCLRDAGCRKAEASALPCIGSSPESRSSRAWKSFPHSPEPLGPAHNRLTRLACRETRTSPERTVRSVDNLHFGPTLLALGGLQRSKN